uniref:Peptidase A2 domain-containing protein n=1 Tax=Cyprinus carpio TaxID=7962 RepID=A0A8C2ES37_CYPCA
MSEPQLEGASGSNIVPMIDMETSGQLNAAPRPVFMPETFTGTGREWSDWADQFEMAAGINGWDDELKLKFMSLLLSGRLSICVGKWEGAGTVDQVPAPVFSAPRLGEMGQSQPGTVGVYMFGKVGGVETRLLVDTGAQVSIVPKQFWLEATGGVGELVEYNGSLSVANGEKMEAVGQWTTICQFDSLAVVMDFVVADINPGEVLLGSDFLVKFGAKLDLGELCCYLMGKKIVIQLQADFQVPPLIIGMLEPGSSLPRHCD